MTWGTYEPLALPFAGNLREAPRADAEACFAALMAARADRAAALAQWLAANGHPGLLARADAPDALGAAVKPALLAAGADAFAGDPRWSALLADVALWLGERIIAAAPSLRWELFTSHKKATGYQRAVLVGFRKVDAEHYYVDLAHFVAAWGELCARGRMARPDFLATIATTTIADA